jgi:UDP-N-acetylglucosamine--dolichyl-phosphate N-acetylglucosaminephosphotransferase
MAYAGGTSIIIPKPLASYVGIDVLELGTFTNPNK